MVFPFTKERDSGLIIIAVSLDNKFELNLVVDTGATHTTLDSNILFLSGYDTKDSVGEVQIETANGIIQTQLFNVNNFTALGISKTPFQIQAYDFLAHGIFSNYSGLLGLDFFEGKKFCLDTTKSLISIE